jgi:hypothetical protein
MAEDWAEPNGEMTDDDGETEATLVADWLATSATSLREVLDNEEDAAYDFV